MSNDLSLNKPPKPEKKPRDYRWLKVTVIVASIVCAIGGLAYISITHKSSTPEPEVHTVVKIDTVYVPAKNVVSSTATQYYDVSEASVISVTVKDGVVEVATEDCNCP